MTMHTRQHAEESSWVRRENRWRCWRTTSVLGQMMMMMMLVVMLVNGDNDDDDGGARLLVGGHIRA